MLLVTLERQLWPFVIMDVMVFESSGSYLINSSRSLVKINIEQESCLEAFNIMCDIVDKVSLHVKLVIVA